MTFNEYQNTAHSTSMNAKIFGSKILYPFFGLAGETGEVFEKMKKRFRDSPQDVSEDDLKTDEVFSFGMKKELGDILWYLSEICTQFGWSLEEVAQINIEKLLARKKNGTLSGSGDNR